MYAHTLAPLETALRDVGTEREQLRDERDAFETFATRVEEISVHSPRSLPAAGSLHASASRRQSTNQTDAFRSAFRETVMAVPHYEAVYGESLEEHAEGELGPDIATGLRSDGPVAPGFKRALFQAIGRGIENRSAVLELLETEANSLNEARSELDAVATALQENSTGEETRTHGDGGEWLPSIACRCQSVIQERQALIQNRVVSPIVDGHDLCVYLYGHAHSWTYPVLSVGTSLQTDIDALAYRTHARSC